MADLKYDLVLPEGRHGLWTALHQEEEKTRRDARIGKIQNLPAALIYVFNVLLVTGFVTNYFGNGICCHISRARNRRANYFANLIVTVF